MTENTCATCVGHCRPRLGEREGQDGAGLVLWPSCTSVLRDCLTMNRGLYSFFRAGDCKKQMGQSHFNHQKYVT